MKTLLEQSFMCTADVFHQYCILNLIDDYLQLKEMKKLMKEQAQPFLKNTIPKDLDQDAYITQLFNKADKNKDGKISYNEWFCVMALCLNETHIRAHDLDGSGHGHTHGPGHGHTHGPDHGHGHTHGDGHGHTHGDGHGHTHGDGHGHSH